MPAFGDGQPTAQALPSAQTRPRAIPVGRLAGKAAVYLLIAAGGALELVPFFWMISSSLKEYSEIFVFPPVWIPKRFAWENYPTGLTQVPFYLFFQNSGLVVVASVVGQVLSASLAAFAFARLRFRGSNALFVLLLTSLMVPIYVTIIPQYILFKTLGWVDTLLPLFVPHWFGSAYYIFLLRQFFLTVPREMDDAARIDGCGTFTVYWRILLPLSAPALAVVALYEFLSSWNDFFRPLIFLNSVEHFTVALGVQFLINYESGIPLWHYLMAVSVVSTLPILIVFFFLQRLFIQGIVISGVKG